MSAEVFSLFGRRRATPRDWSTPEIAEFYRVEAALLQAGLRVTSDRGLTDEGDPWFIFCRAEDDEVIIHLARIDGQYLISAPSYCGTAVGVDFRDLLRVTLQRHPALRPQPTADNLLLHPSALLVMLVATAFLRAGHAAEAATAKPAQAGTGELRERPIVSVDMHESTAGMTPLAPETQHETLILIAVTAALAAPMQPELPTLVVSAAFALDLTLDSPPGAPTVDPSLTVENQSSPPHGVGAGAVTPRAEFQFAQVSESAGHAPAPFAAEVGGTPSLGNGMADVLAQSHSSQELISPPLTDVSQVQAIGLAATTTHSSELAVFGLPKVEQDLLHTFGVTGQIPQVAVLPVAFSSALHAAHHTYISDLSPVTASSPTAAPESTPPQVNTAVAAAPSHPVPPSNPTPTSAPAPAPPEVTNGTTDLPTVLANVSEFYTAVPHTAAAVSGHSIILYDADAINTNLNALKAITYDLADGYSISLVGLPSELAHIATHV
jgi:hypothetical protein